MARLRNYITVAIRNLTQNKLYSVITIGGLAVAGDHRQVEHLEEPGVDEDRLGGELAIADPHRHLVGEHPDHTLDVGAEVLFERRLDRPGRARELHLLAARDLERRLDGRDPIRVRQ